MSSPFLLRLFCGRAFLTAQHLRIGAPIQPPLMNTKGLRPFRHLTPLKPTALTADVLLISAISDGGICATYASTRTRPLLPLETVMHRD